MKKTLIGAAVALTALLAGCQTTGSSMTIADYCADDANTGQQVCQLNSEIKTQASRVTSVESKATSAASAAAAAQSSADAADEKASNAAEMAKSALLNKKNTSLSCKTVTVNKAQSGSCESGYTLTSCVQTRYTYAAGGLSILRNIDETSCSFNTRVLEMQLRCCTMAETTEMASMN